MSAFFEIIGAALIIVLIVFLTIFSISRLDYHQLRVDRWECTEWVKGDCMTYKRKAQ